ncbi:unnamed protein product [Onchocerca flexuosa]|uniref:Uncharacterized protein n=1 Tax=Onchocerca flexuosa TaxID=387005 RepID=A0A183HLK7_9BILA|nr:unnamed protein product [Onchocerca flexuosa]
MINSNKLTEISEIEGKNIFCNFKTRIFAIFKTQAIKFLPQFNASFHVI